MCVIQFGGTPIARQRAFSTPGGIQPIRGQNSFSEQQPQPQYPPSSMQGPGNMFHPGMIGQSGPRLQRNMSMPGGVFTYKLQEMEDLDQIF